MDVAVAPLSVLNVACFGCSGHDKMGHRLHVAVMLSNVNVATVAFWQIEDAVNKA